MAIESAGAPARAPAPLHRLDFVDALRALAVLGVFTIHSGIAHALPAGLQRFALAGASGVQLFFVISAFTMMHSWHARAQGAAAFYLRRFLRIAPIYYLGILAQLAVLGFGPRMAAPDGIGALDLALNAAFLHSFSRHAVTDVVPGGWSIGVEMTFYAAFPLVALMVTTPRRAWLFFALSVASAAAVPSLLRNWFRAGGMPLDEATYFFVFAHPLNQVACFGAGTVAYFLWTGFRALAPEHPLRRLARPLGAALLAAAAALYWLFAPNGIGRLPATALWGVTYATLFMAFALARPPGLVSAPMAALGRISYSVYLVHFFVLEAARAAVRLIGAAAPAAADPAALRGAGALAYMAAALVATLAVSAVTYRFVERPFIALAERLIARRRTAAGANA